MSGNCVTNWQCVPNPNQCPPPPEKPDVDLCPDGTWNPRYATSTTTGIGCVVGWRCDRGTATTTPPTRPEASLSCQPKLADVGMTLAIAFSCSSGTATSSGFDTGGEQSGSATTAVANPPAGTNTAIYALTCNNQGLTAGAQCAVQINKPSIVLVANPKSVPSGQTSLIGWVTSGMQSCVISSPDQSDFTSRNSSNTSPSGVATTSPITRTTNFLLRCSTLGGLTKDATTSVEVAAAATSSAHSISITSNAEGRTINHGDHVTISWQSQGQSPNARVSLWLVDTSSGYTTALIAGAKPVSGTFDWSVPAAASQCPMEALNVCGADLVAGKEDAIEADVYPPANAYVGDGSRPANAVDPVYGDLKDTQAFTVGR